MRGTDGLHQRIVHRCLERFTFVLHRHLRRQSPRFGDRCHQLPEFLEYLAGAPARRPSAGAGKTTRHGRAVEVVAGVQDAEVDPFGTGQRMDVSVVEFILAGGNRGNQIAGETDRVVLEIDVLCVATTIGGRQHDREDHRPHAHHPQLVVTLDNDDPLGGNAAIVDVGDQRLGPVLLGLGFLVSDHGGQPEIAGQRGSRFEQSPSGSQHRGHATLHVGGAAAVKQVPIAVTRLLGLVGDGVEMPVEHQRGPGALATKTRIEIGATRRDLADIHFQAQFPQLAFVVPADLGLVHGHAGNLHHLLGQIRNPATVDLFKNRFSHRRRCPSRGIRWAVGKSRCPGVRPENVPRARFLGVATQNCQRCRHPRHQPGCPR